MSPEGAGGEPGNDPADEHPDVAADDAGEEVAAAPPERGPADAAVDDDAGEERLRPPSPAPSRRIPGAARLIGLAGLDRPGRGPFDPRRWRSPVRGPWLTSVFGSVLLVGIPLEFITGLLSYAAYNPRLAGNDPTHERGLLGFWLFNWFTGPTWLFRLTQGIHVALGLALVPIVLAKLWSVIPNLFAWPPLRSMAQMLERLSLLLLVGGAVFELTTGILNINYDYGFQFSFYKGHYLGAWAFMAGFTIHATMRIGRMRAALRSRRLRDELRTPLAATVAEAPSADGLVPVSPAAPTISRRGVLALVGGTSLSVVVLTVGQTLGGPFRRLALLAPRGQSYGSGPNDFQVNRTAVAAGVSRRALDEGWRLVLHGPDGRPVASLSRSELLGMTQTTEDLPIACVEGWSTVQRWSGVRLPDLARLAGVARPAGARVESLEPHGAYSRVELSGDQVRASRSLLALRVNGVDLSLDHGYPARLILPAAPGVHCTKWVSAISFAAEAR